jgi:hypothetical protein
MGHTPRALSAIAKAGRLQPLVSRRGVVNAGNEDGGSDRCAYA